MRWIWIFAALPLAAAPAVRVRIDASILELPLERYVAGVVAGESSVFRSEEALKAMAVAVRTYAVKFRGRHAGEGYDFCSTTHCQRLDLSGVTGRVERSAADTEGELLWFQGKPAAAYYSRDCGGRTEDATAVWPELAAPYLRSHDDPYCVRPDSTWRWSADPARVLDALQRSGLRAPHVLESIAIARTSRSGRAQTLTLAGGGEVVRIDAGSFRFAMGRALGWNLLPGDRYEVGGLTFRGSGSGHGVGLCQRGADQMGSSGRGYRDILAFYYPGTAVGWTGRGISWQRLGGDSIALMTTHPDRDGAILALAERQLREAAARVNFPLPRDLEIRIYPDLESFRNATGSAGSVAGYTEGRHIHLQPVARDALERTVKHEIWHGLLESQARPGVPLWFREGLAGFFDGSGHPEATRTVVQLVNRYGEATVLGWLRSGLPAEVRNATPNPAAMKRR
jgi:stage II sporulation protein D